jgi:hypothetical protein
MNAGSAFREFKLVMVRRHLSLWSAAENGANEGEEHRRRLLDDADRRVRYNNLLVAQSVVPR